MRFLLLNQTFHPDVMATGQYLTEVALALAAKGHEVTVVTSRRAYDHPERTFPARETWRGIRIVRIWSTGFGKDAKWRRAADFATFLVSCIVRLVFLPCQDVTLALTSPPLISFLGAVFTRLRGGRFVYWVMDMNPDEAIAAGWLRKNSVAARLLEWVSRYSFRHAAQVIALDRFMGDRIVGKAVPQAKIHVLPPWSHDGEVTFDSEGRNTFRRAHGLEGKFVVMYSGNHSPCHPLDTLLSAAERLQKESDIVFCFVGGGSEWRKIKEKAEGGNLKPEDGGPSVISNQLSVNANQSLTESNQSSTDSNQSSTDSNQLSAISNQSLTETNQSSIKRNKLPVNSNQSSVVGRSSNILCLPYEPLDKLSGSLSAADLHVVVMGDAFVGLVHPCKIYNILNVGAPVLCIGPRPSHLSEMLDEIGTAYPHMYAAHGDIEAIVSQIRSSRDTVPPHRPSPPALLTDRFSRAVVLPKLVQVLLTGRCNSATAKL